MTMTSLFDVMQTKYNPQPSATKPPIEPTVFTENEVHALFDFQSEVYKRGKIFGFKVQKGIMPLRGDLFKLLKDAYRCRKDGKVTVKWQTVNQKSMAVRDSLAYQKSIDTLLDTKDRQVKLRHSPTVLEYLHSTKANLASLAAKIKPE